MVITHTHAHTQYPASVECQEGRLGQMFHYYESVSVCQRGILSSRWKMSVICGSIPSSAGGVDQLKTLVQTVILPSSLRHQLCSLSHSDQSCSLKTQTVTLDSEKRQRLRVTGDPGRSVRHQASTMRPLLTPGFIRWHWDNIEQQQHSGILWATLFSLGLFVSFGWCAAALNVSDMTEKPRNISASFKCLPPRLGDNKDQSEAAEETCFPVLRIPISLSSRAVYQEKWCSQGFIYFTLDTIDHL